MKQGRSILAAPFFLALLAAAFCLWIALGNDVNFCVTTGCTLYQDFSFFGISLWWYGAGAFGLLALCALAGAALGGAFFSACFLLADTGFLILMALTAPCVSCLVAAAFFALSYILFRRAGGGRGAPRPLRQSVLIWAWLAFFVINLGAVARSQFEIWPILDEGGDARTRMFFSPTCSHCVEGINALSGNIGTAFYPVADTDDDIYRIAKIQRLLDEGDSLKNAVARAREVEIPGFFAQFSPEMLMLRWRLLANKSHIFTANSGGVPFFEERGLPYCLRAKNRENGSGERHPTQSRNADATLPIDDGSGQCTSGMPCP